VAKRAESNISREADYPPHAALFGGLVAYGELAIGLGVLLGLFLRPAALFGLLINLVFFLPADWRIFPYFYGSDSVFLYCWLELRTRCYCP
jgi:thiosulfate dehydrogenase (quinone) large subunit